jgi:hypothetical protein
MVGGAKGRKSAPPTFHAQSPARVLAPSPVHATRPQRNRPRTGSPKPVPRRLGRLRWVGYADSDLKERSRYSGVIKPNGGPVWSTSRIQPSVATDITDSESFAYSVVSIVLEVVRGKIEDMLFFVVEQLRLAKCNAVQAGLQAALSAEYQCL